MTELEKYELVNVCEYPKELAEAIIKIGSDTGEIQGRRRSFNHTQMSEFVEGVILGKIPPNVLTRSYGIRQQALYLKYYK